MSSTAIYQQINFVPDWYVQKRQRRASLKRQGMLIVLMVVGMAGLWAIGHQRVSGLSEYRNSLQAQLNAAEFQMTEVAKLQSAKATLTEQIRIYREIARPITFGQMVATIGALTPEPVFLVTVKAKTEESTRRRVIPGGGENGRDKTVVDKFQTIHVELEGVAPSNVEIANYIGQLAGNGLFRNVKMEFSREGEIENALTREFRISMEVPLDRPYIFEATEEVADATR